MGVQVGDTSSNCPADQRQNGSCHASLLLTGVLEAKDNVSDQTLQAKYESSLSDSRVYKGRKKNKSPKILMLITLACIDTSSAYF
jgi:hypothetical protein